MLLYKISKCFFAQKFKQKLIKINGMCSKLKKVYKSNKGRFCKSNTYKNYL